MIFLMAFAVIITEVYLMAFPPEMLGTLSFIVFYQISIFLVPLAI